MRRNAAHVAGRAGLVESLDALRTLLRDRDETVAVEAALAIGEIGARDARDRAAEILSGDGLRLKGVRKAAAIRGLARIGDTEPWDKIEDLADDRDWRVATAAIDYLVAVDPRARSTH